MPSFLGHNADRNIYRSFNFYNFYCPMLADILSGELSEWGGKKLSGRVTIVDVGNNV